MIKAVIFDLDGTILDSIDTYWRAFNTAVAVFKLAPVTRESLLTSMSQGASLEEILRRLYPELGLEPESNMAEDLKAAMRKEYQRHGGFIVPLTKGAQELFGLLRSRGIKIGIVTSRTVAPEAQRRELERLGVAQFIDAIVTGTEAPRKPAPDTVIECLKRLELQPDEAIFVGDSQADMLAAKAAGVRTMAVTTGVGHRQVLSAESPDFIFDDLLEFIAKLDLVLGSPIKIQEVAMEEKQYRELFLFAAKAGSLEGYLFKRKEVEPLENWVGNIVSMYQELPAAVKSKINPDLATVLKRALEYGGSLLKPELRKKLENLIATAGTETGKT